MAHRKGKHCKTLTVCGRRRKICFSAKGKITSNKPVGKARRKRR
jgi:hypothetical protein